MYDAIDDNAGHPLDLEKPDPEVMLIAMIESFGGDEKKLARVIKGPYHLS